MTRLGFALGLLLPAVGCSGSDNNNGASGGAASGGSANGAYGGSTASGGIANAAGGATSGGAAANGGSTASGGAAAGSGSGAAPASASQADLGAFLDSGAYKQAPWVADVAEPRPGGVGTQHGDGIRVWQNPTLVAAMRAGHDGREGRMYPDAGSMAVKEMYDSDKKLIGVAAALHTANGDDWGSWTYYCWAPGGRCTSGDVDKNAPLYGNGSQGRAQGCLICHGATIFTKIP